jgi:purine-binding chemotaxis protein CheW
MTETALLARSESNRKASAGGQGQQVNHTWSQFVTFVVNDQFYGIDITKVREIKGWTEPTALPNTPFGMRGVLNLRGVVVPIFDLRCQFGQGETQADAAHVVVIVAIADHLIGILVDAVSDILTLEPGDVLELPKVGSRMDQKFLSGLVTHGDHMVALLQLEQLFDLGSADGFFD